MSLGAWKRTSAGDREAYVHPTLGRVEKASTKADSAGLRWRALRRSGQPIDKDFPTPKAARRALGSDE